jgi:FMN phosphatase YigB (HAD superfamily)
VSGAVVFLLDVDNTLLDSDRVTADLKRHLATTVGVDRHQRYWDIFNDLREEVGYADYLGALQRYRVEFPRDPHLLTISSFLVNYPFANRLFPESLDVIDHLKQFGTVVICSDGDVVFQPRKIERSGLFAAVDGHVLIYVHKEAEIDDIEARYPADHYVAVDDKPALLAAFKAAWGPRVTTVLPLQGRHAQDEQAVAAHAPADITIDRIGRLLDFAVEGLVSRTPPS